MLSNGYRHKLVLLPGYAEMAYRIRELELPALVLADLFLAEKLNEGTSSPYLRSPPLPDTAPFSFPSSASSPARSALGLGFPDSPGIGSSSFSQRPRKTSLLSRQAKRTSGISLPPESPSYFDERSESISVDGRGGDDAPDELLPAASLTSLSRKTNLVRTHGVVLWGVFELFAMLDI